MTRVQDKELDVRIAKDIASLFKLNGLVHPHF